MRELYSFIAIFIGLMLSGCATIQTTKQSAPSPATASAQKNTQLSLNTPIDIMKTPEMIKFFPEGSKIQHHYKVIARETISKFNPVGIKRQEAVIHDALCNRAASMGGDAIINITRDDKKVTGDIVTFENAGVG